MNGIILILFGLMAIMSLVFAIKIIRNSCHEMSQQEQRKFIEDWLQRLESNELVL